MLLPHHITDLFTVKTSPKTKKYSRNLSAKDSARKTYSIAIEFEYSQIERVTILLEMGVSCFF